MTQPKMTAETRHSIKTLIDSDLHCAVSDDDLRMRLARNGYGFRDDRQRRVLVTVPHGVELFDLPRSATQTAQ